MGARRQQLDRVLDEGKERKGPPLEVEAAGLDLGKIKDLLDQRGKRAARGLHRLGVGRLLGRKLRVEQEIGHAQNAVERCANFVGHDGKEAALGAVCGVGFLAFLFLIGKGLDTLFERPVATTQVPVDPGERRDCDGCEGEEDRQG